MTYSISGDLGDIICMMSVVRALGGGHIVLFPSNLTSVRMSGERANLLIPLLSQQDYIDSVRFEDHPVGRNLDSWRRKVRYNDPSTNLLDIMFRAEAPGEKVPLGSWMTVDREIFEFPVVCHKVVKHNYNLNWCLVRSKYPEAIFIGEAEEHRRFEILTGAIRHVKTENLLEAARVVAGSKLFIGSQSVGICLVWALGKRAVLELCPDGVCCDLGRPEVICFREGHEELPEL